MKLWRSTTIAITCVAVGVASACVRTRDGVPIADSSGPPTSSSSRPNTATPTTDNDQGPPGILPTMQVPVPAGAITCPTPNRSAIMITAATADPGAPQIMVAVPPGWKSSTGSGDVGARMEGPDGMSAVVTIAPTELDPAAAFRDYTDRLMAQSAVSSVSILPGELCDYSGQKLMGAWSDTPQNSIEFTDRIVHVWTNTKNYLVSVHVQAPTGVRELDAAGELLTEDFEVRIP
jgi:hypothetical protein